MRSFDALKYADTKEIKAAKGKNPNSFFRVSGINETIISEKAKLNKPGVKNIFEYDIATQKGQVVELIRK